MIIALESEETSQEKENQIFNWLWKSLNKESLDYFRFSPDTYCLLAVDGSDICTPKNSADLDSLSRNQNSSFNLYRLNALYDLPLLFKRCCSKVSLF